ncbi:MAG: Ldh family oxidoreductase [Pseudonocardiaceae bacterium]|nr:Ldh family oxidoreductase [Pseudonocardiaceae bacterium]
MAGTVRGSTRSWTRRGARLSDESRIDSVELREMVEGIFTGCQVPDEQAGLIADHLVQANLRGVDSHGVSRVGVYVDRIEQSLVSARTALETVHETPVSALVDGGNGSGIVVAERAMRLAVSKALDAGVGLVSARGSNHCGMLAYYTAMAARAGLIGFAVTSAPPTMAPWGARTPFFGTNPLSYAIPMAERDDIVFDMATSQVARGKIILAAKEGRNIPVGWALTTDGQQTEDADAALDGVMLPLGGPKGSGLALLVETLSSALSAAPFGPHIPPLYHNPDHTQQLGHFFMALRPDLFRSPSEFAATMTQLAGEITALPALPGHDRVYLPGEIEARTARDRVEHGIPISQEVRDELIRLSGRLDAATGNSR